MTIISKYVNIYYIILILRKEFSRTMDNELDIVIEGDFAYVFTPYSDAFVKKIKDRISGRMYVPQVRCWCIPVEAIQSER